MMLHLYYGAVMLLMLGAMAFCIVVIGVELARAVAWSIPRAQVRKVGGLYFWRVGRLGGSIYFSKSA